MSNQVALIHAWRFAREGDISTGVFDQLAKFGTFVKDGDYTTFNAETLGQIVDNHDRRGNLLSMDKDHELFITGNSAALAFYSALVVVKDSKVIKRSRMGADIPFDPAGRSDGLYGCRVEVTPRGESNLRDYKYISPAFVTEGNDEQGNEVGYELVNVAATNTPFLSGMQPIAYTRFSTGPGPVSGEAKKMEDEKEKAGAAEDKAPNPQEIAGEDLFAKLCAMAESDEETKKKLIDMAKKFAEVSEEPKEEQKFSDDNEEEEEDKEAVKAMCRDLGIKSDSRPSVIYSAFAAKTASLKEVADLRKELSELRAEKIAAEQKAETIRLEKFADDAIEQGRWDGAKRSALIAFARADFASAEASLLDKGVFHALKTYTKSGKPVGESRDVPEIQIENPREVFATEARKYSKEHNVSLANAQVAVAKERPDLLK